MLSACAGCPDRTNISSLEGSTPINNRPGRSRDKETSRRKGESPRSKTIAARSFSSRLCRALGEPGLTQRTSRVESALRLAAIPAMLRELPYTATRLCLVIMHLMRPESNLKYQSPGWMRMCEGTVHAKEKYSLPFGGLYFGAMPNRHTCPCRQAPTLLEGIAGTSSSGFRRWRTSTLLAKPGSITFLRLAVVEPDRIAPRKR